MRAVAGQAVWASIDQEAAKNRAFLDRFAVQGLPTFLLLDPKDESVLGQWLGSGTVAQMRDFVRGGVLELKARKEGGAREGSPLAARKADEAAMRGDFIAASAAYELAVARSGPGDSLRAQWLVGWTSALRRLGSVEALRRCVEVGLAELDRTGDTSLAADFASGIAGCAEALAEKEPAAKEQAAKVREAVLARLGELLALPGAPLSADDRSDALSMVTDLEDQAGRHDKALAAAQTRVAVLRAAQAGAPDPEMASTFDAHLTQVLMYLKRFAAAEELLAARIQQMPRDYNPLGHLARVLLEEKKLPEAERTVDRALALLPRGPRRVGLLGLKSRILIAGGKADQAVVREQLEILETLPRTQRRPELEKRLRAKLVRPNG
jgi:tetratricopeptide (TPR) repeat protein